MEMKYFGVLLVALLLVSPAGYAATGKSSDSGMESDRSSATGPLRITSVWTEADPQNPGNFVLYAEVLDGALPARMENTIVTLKLTNPWNGALDDLGNIGYNAQNPAYINKNYYGVGLGQVYCGKKLKYQIRAQTISGAADSAADANTETLAQGMIILDCPAIAIACPTKSPIKVNCNAIDSAVAQAREWTGADGCKYECDNSITNINTCPTKSTLKVSCDSADSAVREWTGADGCKYECANSNQVMCPDTVPSCQGGTELYKYTDANGCTIFGCRAVNNGFSEVNAVLSTEPHLVSVGETIKAVGTVSYEQDPRLDAKPSAKKFKVVLSMQNGYGATSGTAPGAPVPSITPTEPVPSITPAAPVPSISTQGTASGEIRFSSVDGWDNGIVGSTARAISEIFNKRDTSNTEAGNINSADDNPGRSNDDDSTDPRRSAPGGVASAVSAGASSVSQERTDYVTLNAGEKKSVEAYFTASTPGTKVVRMQVYEYAGTECPSFPGQAAGAPGSRDAASCRDVYNEVANAAIRVKVAGEMPPPIPTVDPTVASAVIELRSGWNMVSVPINSKVDMRGVSEKCNSASYAWRLTENGYAKESVLVPGYGYWIKSTGACRYEVSGNSATTEIAQLFAGWNLVGAPGNEAELSSYAGNCQVTAGPWYYSKNAATDSASPYSYSANLQPGKAYWIKVAGACQLGIPSDEQPPVPPS